MFMYSIISRESHFQLQVLAYYGILKAYKIPDFIRFKAPVIGLDLFKRSHHYLKFIGIERFPKTA